MSGSTIYNSAVPKVEASEPAQEAAKADKEVETTVPNGAPAAHDVSRAATEIDLNQAHTGAPEGPAESKEEPKAAKDCKRKEVQKELFVGSTGIDLAFLVDATCSMQPYIEAVGEQCIAIAEDIAATHGKESELKVAFVAYRDLDSGTVNVESLDFTTDIESFKKYVRDVRVHSGVDWCEDVFGGLERAGQLSWSQGPGNARCLFHMGDAPCHGRAYHNYSARNHSCGMDRWLEGDPQQRDLAVLLRQLKEVQGVDNYTFTHITRETTRMLEEFKKVYEGDDWISEDHLRTETRTWDDVDNDLYEPSSIADEMTRSVRSSVMRSVNSSFRTGSNSMRSLPTRPAATSSAPPATVSAPPATAGVLLAQETAPRAPCAPPRNPGFSNVSSAATVRAVTMPRVDERSSQDREAELLADLIDGLMTGGYTEANAAGSAANGSGTATGSREEGARQASLASAATVRGGTVRASEQSSW